MMMTTIDYCVTQNIREVFSCKELHANTLFFRYHCSPVDHASFCYSKIERFVCAKDGGVNVIGALVVQTPLRVMACCAMAKGLKGFNNSKEVRTKPLH